LVAVTLTVAVLAAVSVKLHLITYTLEEPASCTALGAGPTTYKLTPEQAAVATTIAASAKRLGLPNHAVTVGLATALQESKLRNLKHGDRDSVGVFQQRPSMGWGSKQQLHSPDYAASAFFSSLGDLPNWQTLSVNDAAQAVQRSAFPAAYGKWEAEGRALARDLTGEVAAGLTCRFGAVRTFMDQTVSKAMAAELGTTGVTLASGATGWTVATWLVAHARQYSVHTISYGGYRWTTKAAGWRYVGGTTGAVTFS
jgi:hypothetical protein